MLHTEENSFDCTCWIWFQKKKREMEAVNNEIGDIISDLPSNVIDCILTLLPLRDTVRTSMLSRKWRYRWTTIPELVVDDKCIPGHLLSNPVVMTNRLVKFVDRVLLLHRGPIKKFKLSVSFLLSCPDIDHWLLSLASRDIKEFSLELEEREWYKVPSSIFYCQQLTHLELFRCELLPPLSFNGFKNLKSLSLRQSFFESEDIEKLISNCPVLESFCLAYFEPLSIKIRAPSLKYLRLEGEFKDICIENAPLLVSISIALYMNDEIADHLEGLTTFNIMKALGRVPSLERLVAESYFVKIELCQVGFEDVNEIAVAICLLVSSLNLEQLIISASSDIDAWSSDEDSDFWEKQHQLDCSFNHLHTVKMTDISGISNELDFIKFVLARSPKLEAMSIKPSIYLLEGGCGMLIELLQFPRASPHAGITYIQA